MAWPHPALIDLAAGHELGAVTAPDVLVRSAIEHRMTGLLLDRVRLGEVQVSGADARLLAQIDLQEQAHHRRLWSALVDIQARLRAIGIEVATAKGVAAEVRWYDREGARPCHDLDLLVDPAAAGRFGDLVRALQPEHVLAAHADAVVADGHLQSVDVRTESGLEADVHADIFKVEIPVRPHVVWTRTVRVVGPRGEEVRALDAEMSLVHFLLHLNKDRFARLLGLVDIARILERESLDWRFIDDFCRGVGLETPVYLALDAVVAVLDLPPPPVGRPRGWRARAWRRLWPREEMLLGPIARVSRYNRQLWLPWLARGRTREAAEWWVKRRLFPPGPLVAYYLPETRGPYLWRLLTGRLSRRRQRREAVRQALEPG